MADMEVEDVVTDYSDLSDDEILAEYEAQFKNKGRGPRHRKRIRQIVGAEPGSYVYNTKRPTHPALDYAILRWTEYERLLTPTEAAAICGFNKRKVQALIARDALPHIFDGVRNLIAAETAILLKEVNEQGPAQRRIWKQATDRSGWKRKYETDEKLRQRVIDGHAVTKAKQRKDFNVKRKEKRDMERPLIRKIPIWRKDPWTDEKYVARYKEVSTIDT